jgi:hypothetical protein
MIPAILGRSGCPDLIVWISQTAKPENGRPITLEKFLKMDLKPEIWISMAQVYENKPRGDWWFRTSYQVDEWLIGGAMPKSRVLEILPCHGKSVIYEDEFDQGVVTEYLREVEYWWDCKLTVWRRSEEDEQFFSEVISIDEKSRKRPCYEIEETNGSDSSAQSQQRCFKKRKYSRTMARNSHIKLNEGKRKEADGQAEAELVGSSEEESKEDLALGSGRDFEVASDEEKSEEFVKQGDGQDQNETIVIED